MSILKNLINKSLYNLIRPTYTYQYLSTNTADDDDNNNRNNTNFDTNQMRSNTDTNYSDTPDTADASESKPRVNFVVERLRYRDEMALFPSLNRIQLLGICEGDPREITINLQNDTVAKKLLFRLLTWRTSPRSDQVYTQSHRCSILLSNSPLSSTAAMLQDNMRVWLSGRLIYKTNSPPEVQVVDMVRLPGARFYRNQNPQVTREQTSDDDQYSNNPRNDTTLD